MWDIQYIMTGKGVQNGNQEAESWVMDTESKTYWNITVVSGWGDKSIGSKQEFRSFFVRGFSRIVEQISEVPAVTQKPIFSSPPKQLHLFCRMIHMLPFDHTVLRHDAVNITKNTNKTGATLLRLRLLSAWQPDSSEHWLTGGAPSYHGAVTSRKEETTLFW